MSYGPKTLNHYLKLFLKKHGITDSDCTAEIDDLCESFQKEFDKLTERCEKMGDRLSALEDAEEERVAAENLKQMVDLYKI